MATEAYPDFTCGKSYSNIVATIGGIANTECWFQNIGGTDISLVPQASGSAPTTKTGIILRPREAIKLTGAQVWVKSFGGSSGIVGIVSTGA